MAKRYFYLSMTLVLLTALTMQASAQVRLISPGETAILGSSDRCSGSKSGEATINVPLVGPVPVALAGHSCDTESRTVRAFAVLTAAALGIYDPRASSYVENTFTLRAGNVFQPTVLDGLISARVDWSGILAGFGINTSSDVSIKLVCLDAANGVEVGSLVMHEKSGGSSNPTDAAALDRGGNNGSFRVKLTRGRSYNIRMILETHSHVGVGGVLVVSAFDNLNLPGQNINGFARLTELAVTVDADLLELVTMVKDQVTQLQGSVNTINNSITTLNDNLNGGFTLVRADIASLNRSVDNRFNNVDASIAALNRNVNNRFDVLQQNIDNRFSAVDQRLASIGDRLNQTFDVVNVINRNTTVMIDQLTTLQSSVNTANNKLEVIDNKADTIINKSDTIIGKVDTTNNNVNIVGGKVDDLTMKLLDFQRRAFRLEIEQALVEGDRYNVTSFQMPKSSGGNLEEVRSVVAEIIDMCSKSSMPSASAIEQAKNQMATGDIYFNAGGYKDAYDHYRAAYLHVATVTGNHRP